MDFLRQYLLSILICLPAVGAIAVLFIPRRAVRWTSLGICLATFVASLLIPMMFDRYAFGAYRYYDAAGVVQLWQRFDLLPLHFQYCVGIDGLSLPLVILTTFMSVPACLASWKIERNAKSFFLLLLLLESSVLGAFLALDFVLFFNFVELSLILLFLLLGAWGGNFRSSAMAKMFLAIFVSSVALLIALIQTYLHGGSFNLIDLARIGNYTPAWASRCFALAMFAFLIWLPAVPLHAWLADVQEQANVSVNMLLAAMVQNIGGYGVLRIGYALFPQSVQSLWFVGAILGVVTILYPALCAVAQGDLNRLISYNSISQGGFFILGISMGTLVSINGALLVLVARSLSVAAMFFIAHGLFERTRHRELSRFGGLGAVLPAHMAMSFVAFLCAMGLPFLGGFVGEICVLLGMFQTPHRNWIVTRLLAPLVCLAAVFTAGYLLRALQRIFLGATRPENEKFPAISGRELAVLTPITLAMILLGILPWFLFFAFTNRTVAALLYLNR
jgi:NADH-quinone oxidoreductase subunit M